LSARSISISTGNKETNMGFPFLPIALVISSLIPSLFGKKSSSSSGSGGLTTTSEEEGTNTTTTPRKGYQSPFLGLMDAQMAEMITQLMGNMGGAGMPGGVGFRSPSNMNFLDAIRASFPDLLGAYGVSGATPYGGSDLEKERAEKEQDMQRGGGEPSSMSATGTPKNENKQNESGRKGFPPKLNKAR
jgi:hypothetical protein